MRDDPAPPQLRDWFNEARYQQIASDLATITDAFNAKVFLRHTLDGLADRSLLERVRRCATGIDVALSGTFRSKVAVLKELAPRIDHEFIAIFLADFVSAFGSNEPEFSMEALRFFTVFGSSEFAVRPFIVAAQSSALETMLSWTNDADEKVRRLASEGSRPRLPWGMRLPSLVRDPNPTAPILEALKSDDSLFVRRSVANHLNDVTKDHPDWVMERLEGWDLSDPKLSWIAKHACRTLIKRGHPRALALFGFGKKASVNAELTATPIALALGERLTLTASLFSTAKSAQRLAVDYVVHYVKANGSTAEKVFKWTELDLPAGGRSELAKSQVIRDFTTRKHYEGDHKVELQVNGQRVAEATFSLAKQK